MTAPHHPDLPVDPDLPADPADAVDAVDRRLDAELAAGGDWASSPLAQLLAPPADLGARTQSRAAETLMSRSVIGTAADLLTVGWQTVRVLFGPDDDEEVTP